LAERLEKLEEIFQRRENLYKSLDIKMAAAKLQDQWYNTRTKILLSFNEPEEKSQKVIDTGNFVVLHQVMRSGKFLDLLETINKNGCCKVNDFDIVFFDPQKHPYLEYWDWLSADSEKAKEAWKIDWPLDFFQWSSEHKLRNELDEIFKTITPMLNCHDPPFESVFEAVRETLALRGQDFMGPYEAKDSVCYLIMPGQIAIKDCILDGNDFQISVKFHESIDIQDLRLSLIVRGRKLLRCQVALDGAVAKSQPPIKEVSKNLVLEDAVDVQAFLFVKDEEERGPSDRRSIRNRKSTFNLRLMAHEEFDERSETLQEWLRGRGRSKSRNFEYAVSTLLHFCGFHTEWIGHGGVAEEAPDVFAFHSKSRTLIVAECTVKVPDINKLRDLRERAGQLQGTLMINVKPVIFTCLERFEASIEKEATDLGITIVYLDRLKEMFDMTSRGKPTEDIVDYIFGRSIWRL